MIRMGFVVIQWAEIRTYGRKHGLVNDVKFRAVLTTEKQQIINDALPPHTIWQVQIMRIFKDKQALISNCNINGQFYLK